MMMMKSKLASNDDNHDDNGNEKDDDGMITVLYVSIIELIIWSDLQYATNAVTW